MPSAAPRDYARLLDAIIADIVHDLGAVADFDRTKWQRRSPGAVQYLCALANRRTGQPRPAEPAAPRPPYQDAPLNPDLEDADDPTGAFASVLRHVSLTRDRR